MKIWLKNHKNAVRIVICIVIIVVGLAYLIIDALPEEETSSTDEIMEKFDRLDATLGDEWNREYITESEHVTLSDPEGNTIIYYVCKTTYYAADPAEVTGLNIAGIRGIIDPETVESSRECNVKEMPGMIYEKGGRSYLCWTDTPEYSLILEYTPEAVSEEDIIRMAESVERVA